MSNPNDSYVKARALARAARQGPLAGLLGDPNVSGLAYGRREVSGRRTDEPALVVYVVRKVPRQFLPTTRLLPRRVYFGSDFVEVDVVETGPFFAQEFTARERPAPNGVSVAHIDVTAGTLGALVTDNTDGSLCVLSNNHVLANSNAGAIGDAIVQPGAYDGGTAPADTIATLKRFVMINPAGNRVDCAIGQVAQPNDVIDQVKDNIFPVANSDHPAIGLLFAGSCNRTLINPIDEVLRQLDVTFLSGAGAIAGVDIGSNVEKVGRTTEYTTSTVTELDVSASIDYGPGVGVATFEGQIATAHLSEGGDSGSVVYLGGEGGNESACGCASSSTARRVLDRDVDLDVAVEKEFRQRYLQQTRVGRFAVDTYFANEDGLVARARATKLSDADRRHLQKLYDTYAETARAALLQPHRSEATLTTEHLDEARKTLRRFADRLTAEEISAAEEVLALANDAVGRTPVEILRMLDDEQLLHKAQELVERVPTLCAPGSGRRGDGGCGCGGGGSGGDAAQPAAEKPTKPKPKPKRKR
ncbi:hypothetical protein ACLQ29_27210 [Micromonospora sp. DT228]|uniref:hypothetical protein n=1 Tax=Micromonospora sp. DT228 TaxID=3393443 RepID=UPI003CF20BE0